MNRFLLGLVALVMLGLQSSQAAYSVNLYYYSDSAFTNYVTNAEGTSASGPNTTYPAALNIGSGANQTSLSGTISTVDLLGFDSLNSSFTLTRGSNPLSNFVLVQIVQDAYTFAGPQNNFSNRIQVTSNSYSGASTILTSTFYAGTVTYDGDGRAIAGSSSVSNGPRTVASGSSFTTTAVSNFSSGSSGNSIVQQFFISNLRGSQVLTFNVLSTVSTPVPATALALLAGVPVLALARRRLFA